MTSAVVVGAGPNGLAAAVTLAQRGIEVTVVEAADTIGGGMRTSENTVPGLLHDDCAAVVPIALASPFFRSLDLETHGLRWGWPAVDLAHPLDGGRAGVMMRSIEETSRLLGADGPRWRRMFGPLAVGFDQLADDLLRPILHLPQHPLGLARFSPAVVLPATVCARLFRTAEAKALFAGNAAHGWYPLTRPTSAVPGFMFAAAGHRYGWPVVQGGTSRIADVLALILADFGAKIETGRCVRSRADLPPADVVLFDLSPGAVADILGDTMPPRVQKAYRRFRFGAAAFKIDLAVEGGIPWTNEHCRAAGTVHVCGSIDEVVAAERDTHAGRMPQHPFIIVAQQYLADPSRSVGELHPVYAYAHVPHGFTGDATGAILSQIERFAPGFRDRIVASYTRNPTDLQRYNANYIGGDIIGGANNPVQIVMRPRVAVNPYHTGVAGTYICSASTPPGVGVHGMGGHNAALCALDFLDR